MRITPVSYTHLSVTKILRNPSDSCSGATADDIVVIPINNKPKPTTMLAISLDERLFPVSMMITPSMTAIGARVAGLRNLAHSTDCLLYTSRCV